MRLIMKLLYTNIFKIDGEYLNLEFEFSDDYQINYNAEEKKIIMIKQESQIPQNFFGMNIDKINIVVGKNASRKTTLLNLLGLNQIDLYKNFDKKNDSWFSIYENDNNEYIIEGNNFDLILDIVPLKNHKQDYVIIGNYDFCKQRFDKCKFVADDKNFSDDKKMRILYMPSDITKRKLSHTIEYRGGFERVYISRTSVTEKINFLNTDYLKMIEYSSRNNDGVQLELKVSKSEEKLLPNSDGETINLYGLNELLVEIISNKSWRMILGREKTVVDFFDDKQKFILFYLEQQIISAWNSNEVYTDSSDFDLTPKKIAWSKNIVDEIKSYSRLGMLDTPDFIDESSIAQKFSDLVDYQRKVLVKLSIFLEEQNMGGDPNSAYTKSILEFLTQIEKMDVDFFSNYRKISVLLSGQKIPTQILELCELLDRYAFSGDSAYNSLNNEIEVSVPKLSDGQRNLIDLMTKIRSGIYNERYGYTKRVDNLLIILDEPGVYLHPEWLRKLIFELVRYLESVHPEIRFTILITTHSPFLISDIPDTFVLKINNRNDGLRVEKDNGGYGNNIYELLKSSFFLDAPIGKFAENKINALFKKVKQRDSGEVDTIIKEINLIADHTIRKILFEELNKSEDTFEKNSFSLEYVSQLIEENERLKSQIREINDNDR